MAKGHPNLTKQAPLSAHALDCLRSLARAEQPRQHFNAGVTDKFSREGLAELFDRVSPYNPRERMQWLRITDLGRAKL